MAYDAKAYGQYTGNWAAGGGTSNSWGERDVTGDSQHDLHDRVVQGTSFVRSLTSTVVVQATQTERNHLQTRRVANHNHCHALTIQYYEVLRHFRLETRFVRRRKAILIPFTPITFTTELALRFRTLLEQALLDRALAPSFEALVRLVIGPDAYGDEEPPAPPSSPPSGPNYYAGTVTGLVVDSQTPSTDTGRLIEKGSAVTATATSAQGIKFAQGQIDAYGPQGSPAIADRRFPGEGLHAGALLAQIGGDLYEVGIGANFTARHDGVLKFLFNDYSQGDNKGTASVDFTVTRPETPPPLPTDPREDRPGPAAVSERNDRIHEQRLLRHLNGNAGYYNRAIWMLMDSTERRLYIEAALGVDADLLAGLDDTPLAVSGSHVAFPYNGPAPTSGFDAEPEPPPLTAIVTLPTRGLFAEAQLGHCNACELRDITRNSDWTEMTTEEPPAIAGIEPGPQGQFPGLTPTQLPANVIQIAQPPNAPDPGGLAAALKLLGTANLFRDMSALDEASALLGKLADGTVTTLAGMVGIAKQAKEKVDTERAKGNAGSVGDGTTGNGSSTKQSPKERLDNLQVAEQLANADLGLDDQQKAKLIEDIIRGGNGSGGGGGGGGGGEGGAQPSLVLAKAADVAIDIGTDVVKTVIHDFLQAKNLSVASIKDGAVFLRGYPDLDDDYIGRASGSHFDGLKTFVRLENLAGGIALDGLYGYFEISWDDGYTLDPDRLKPEHQAKKPYLPYIWCKQNIRIVPHDFRVGQAIVDAKLTLDLVANKRPTPGVSETGMGPSLSYLNAEFQATLLISINIQSNFGGGAWVDTVEIPVALRHGYNQSTIRVVNKPNGEGFEERFPPMTPIAGTVTL
jgi:hypothetical protein